MCENGVGRGGVGLNQFLHNTNRNRFKISQIGQKIQRHLLVKWKSLCIPELKEEQICKNSIAFDSDKIT